jgi:hypothetical protein
LRKKKKAQKQIESAITPLYFCAQNLHRRFSQVGRVAQEEAKYEQHCQPAAKRHRRRFEFGHVHEQVRRVRTDRRSSHVSEITRRRKRKKKENKKTKKKKEKREQNHLERKKRMNNTSRRDIPSSANPKCRPILNK